MLDKRSEHNTFSIISGPCSLESYEQLYAHLKNTKSTLVRAGLFKMRTKSESFQGLRAEGIEIIKRLKSQFDFTFVSEVVSKETADILDEIVDVFQIGTRNMYNYELIKYLDKFDKPIILKRGFSATVEEWINAAKYIKNHEEKVILCERGVRSFETSYRNMLDLNAVAYLKANTNYKVIVDPSHGTGIRELVKPLSLASMAAGADGIIIETHFDPKNALSDKDQALSIEDQIDITNNLNKLSDLMDKKVIY